MKKLNSKKPLPRDLPALTATQRAKLRTLFRSYKTLKVVYLFGSHARGEAKLNSDIDFAIYLDERNSLRRAQQHVSLSAKIPMILKKDAVDVVLLDATAPPELCYNIMAEGIMLYEIKPSATYIYPGFLNRHFEWQIMRSQVNARRRRYD